MKFNMLMTEQLKSQFQSHAKGRIEVGQRFNGMMRNDLEQHAKQYAVKGDGVDVNTADITNPRPVQDKKTYDHIATGKTVDGWVEIAGRDVNKGMER